MDGKHQKHFKIVWLTSNSDVFHVVLPLFKCLMKMREIHREKTTMFGYLGFKDASTMRQLVKQIFFREVTLATHENDSLQNMLQNSNVCDVVYDIVRSCYFLLLLNRKMSMWGCLFHTEQERKWHEHRYHHSGRCSERIQRGNKGISIHLKGSIIVAPYQCFFKQDAQQQRQK